jgi:hypothetical protein
VAAKPAAADEDWSTRLAEALALMECHFTPTQSPEHRISCVQARPASAGQTGAKDGDAAAAAELAAAVKEWSARLAEALALCQDQEAALGRLQRQSIKDRK